MKIDSFIYPRISQVIFIKKSSCLHVEALEARTEKQREEDGDITGALKQHTGETSLDGAL